jgi:zinc protease
MLKFYKRWYVPNNVTPTIAGDIDVNQDQNLGRKIFGEIKR